MGLLFRKRLRLGKFLSVNLSKSGIDLSVGPTGAKLSLNPKRARMQVGIPGTGIGYRRDVSLTSAHDATPPDSASRPEVVAQEGQPVPHLSISWLILGILLVGLLLGPVWSSSALSLSD